ncbi:zinc finger HIT domain-containing protein 3-like [Ostrea edulis]|uniref:zinc finger HIT domain-containing protein 3-like n=1 Tax=Ostrea edulis TaxID=37623 RepID=UPI0024AF6AB1|nr:zinc finger HIT domain-containing protein 3-like [Ostrea edulis]
MANKGICLCEVCQSSTPKYKCPKCVIRYCSLSCYKIHKENVCSQLLPDDAQDKKPTTTESHEAPKKIPEFDLKETEDRVRPETLQCLRENPDLLLALENPHLRSLMTNLVSSNNPSEDMERVMREPLFLEFSDQCLKVVDNNSPMKVPEG